MDSNNEKIEPEQVLQPVHSREYWFKTTGHTNLHMNDFGDAWYCSDCKKWGAHEPEKVECEVYDIEYQI